MLRGGVADGVRYNAVRQYNYRRALQCCVMMWLMEYTIMLLGGMTNWNGFRGNLFRLAVSRSLCSWLECDVARVVEVFFWIVTNVNFSYVEML